MDIHELAIDDIVRDWNGEIIKITDLTTYGGTSQYAEVNTFDGVDVIFCKNLIPIYLRDPMFPLNGFKVDETKFLKNIWHLGDFTVVRNLSRNFYTIYFHSDVKTCYTVNELQHFLRSCGFPNLANNFKIE